MRNWFKAAVPVLAVVCVVLAGCKKNPPAADKDVQVEKDTKPKEPIAKGPAVKSPAPPPPPAPKQPDNPQPEPKEPKPPVIKSFDPNKGVTPPKEPPPVKEPESTPPPPTVFTPKDLPALGALDKKKDKDKEKDTTKSPKDGKDPKTPEFKEPSEFGGKTFKEWLVHTGVKEKDPGKREEAYKAITAFGPAKGLEALPEIVADLNRHPNPVVDLSVRVNGIVAISTIYSGLPMIKKEPDPDIHKKIFAMYKRFLNDPQVIVKIRVLQALPRLGNISRGALDDVIRLTEDTQTWEVRKEAMECLVWLAAPDGKGAGPNAKAITAFKKALLRDRLTDEPLERSYFVRQTALMKLAMLSQGAGKIPVELRSRAVLEDPSQHVRLTALQALANLKNEIDKQELPLVVKALNNHLTVEKDVILNIYTHWTIMILTDVNETHMAPVVKRLRESKEVPVKLQALTVIASGGAKSKKYALQDVLAATDDKEGAVKASAYIALVNMLHFDPILAKFKDKAPNIRIQALELVQMAGEAAKPFCLNDVKTLVADKDLDVAEAAIVTLEYMNAFETIPMLEKLANDKTANATVREAADEAAKGLKVRRDDVKKKDEKKDKK